MTGALLAEAQAKVDAKARRRALAEQPHPSLELRGFDAADLVENAMPDPDYIVAPFVPEGVMLCCGRPKLGKTTLLRQLAFEANRGGTFFDEACERSDVLFLSLEEGERVMKKKLRALSIDSKQLKGIRFEFVWPQGAAGVQLLRERLLTRASVVPSLIIIDSLTRFRVPPSERGNAFTEDYNTVKMLADLCKEFPGLAIVVLHHTTKASTDDPVAAISGTYGLSAAAENYLILLKQGDGFRLHCGGRLWDRDVSDYELKREAGGWSLVGEWDIAAPSKLPPKQQQAIDFLKLGAKATSAIAKHMGQSNSSASHLMGSLEDKGLVTRIANGWGLSS